MSKNDYTHPTMTSKNWKTTLRNLSSSLGHPDNTEGICSPLSDDLAGIRALELAAAANEKGTYGVGAVLLDASGSVVCEAHNEVHLVTYRSDLHAEMVLINKWEDENTDSRSMGQYTIISTLEPCPMCMTRIIFSGIGTIRYLCSDSIGGMVQRKDSLPPIFRELTQRQQQEWGEARCSDILRALAFSIWDDSRERLDDTVVKRSL